MCAEESIDGIFFLSCLQDCKKSLILAKVRDWTKYALQRIPLRTGDAKGMLKTLIIGSPLTLHFPRVSGMCTFILFAHLLQPKLETT